MKKDFNAQSVRAVTSQVRVAYNLVWRSLTTFSFDNAFRRLFRAAKKEAERESSTPTTHKLLAYEEMKQVGFNEDEFSLKLQNDANMFRIVYCPCVPGFKLSDLKRYNVDCDIKTKLAKYEKFMVDNSYVDAIRGRPTGHLLHVLNRKDYFVTKLASYIIQNVSTLSNRKGTVQANTAFTAAGEIYKMVCQEISGGSNNVSLLDKSFVARHEIISLASLCPYGIKVDVNILQVPSPKFETVNELICNCQMSGPSACKNKAKCPCFKEGRACQKACYCSRNNSCGNKNGQAGQTDITHWCTPKKRRIANGD